MRRWVIAVAALMLGASGCAHSDLSDPRWNAASTAFAASAETDAGRALQPQLEANRAKSGLLLLNTGLDAFSARILMIDGAERAIDVQYYIFHDDLTGRFMFSRLLAAAERGVRVRMLLDDLGSPGLDELLAAANAHPRMEIRLFNALARGPLAGAGRALDLLSRPRRLNHRMHNKMLAVDGLVAVIGGRNIGDEYFDADAGVNFADTDLLAIGPVLDELGRSFDLYWNSEFASPVAGWGRLRATPGAAAALRTELDAHEADASETAYATRLRNSSLYRDVQEGSVDLIWAPTHVVADLPEKVVARGDELEATLLSNQIDPYFDDASSELTIVSPYFVPRDSGVEFMAAAVARGVRVRVLTNSLAATDVSAVHAAYKDHRRAMLEAGVELYEMRRSGAFFRRARRAGLLGSSSASLHAKTFVFDREHVFVGSLNLDPRSIDLNTEIGLVVRSPELAEDRLRSFDRVTNPEVAWKLSLDEDGDLVWEGTESGKPLRLHREPETTAGTRFLVWFLGLLPIDGQL